jgi:hypothetical protein
VPHCGRQFVSVNRNHSCGHYRLEDHFVGKEPVVRQLYMLLLEALEQFGPVGVFPVKTRIIFQAEVQFAAAMPHKRWLDISGSDGRQAIPKFVRWKWESFETTVIYFV